MDGEYVCEWMVCEWMGNMCEWMVCEWMGNMCVSGWLML